MIKRIRFLGTLSTGILAALLAIFFALIAAPSTAQAVQATGHGAGYLSSTGWWIGSYQLADGTLGFCLQAGKTAPPGHDFDYVDGASLGWYNDDDAAKLAYVSRTWAASTDPTTAAAGQLATWTVTGLNGHDQSWYAARAGERANEVLERANAMLAEANREASRGVSAQLALSVSETGPSTVRTDLAIDRLAGPAVAAAGRHRGSVTLMGAVFDDGSPTRTIDNGTDYVITTTGTNPTVSVTASVDFAELPYGKNFTVAHNPGDVQNMLVARLATASASAQAGVTAISPLPFQPRVETVTSAATAQPGAAIHDQLTVSVQTGEGHLPSWPVYRSGDTTLPVPLMITSELLGPFDEEIVPADSAPEGAPVACTVRLTVTAPGQYTTPDCVLPAAGNYVWVERILPSDTAIEQGGSRIRPWVSAFGIASEITRVAAPVVPGVLESRPASTLRELAETGSDSSGPLAPAIALIGAGILGIAAARFATARRPKEGVSDLSKS